MLPRVRDVVKYLTAFLAQAESDEEQIELAEADFVDAYQTIGVHPDDQRHRVIAVFDGSYYVMCSVAFGGAGSPLILGRAAAFLGRSGQVSFSPSQARLEVSADDPLAVLEGTQPQRTRNLTVLVLWWLALGPDLSWNKIQRSSNVNWIEVEISAASPRSAMITLPTEFIAKLLNNIDVVVGIRNWLGSGVSIVGTTEPSLLRVFGGACFVGSQRDMLFRSDTAGFWQNI